MRKYPVAWFYILAFGMSWLGMISAVLASRGIAPFYRPYFLILSIFYAIGSMSEYPFLWFISITADAFMYTWIYNSTKGSILLVALFHGSGNIVGAFIPGVSPVAYALVNCVVAVALIAVFGRANLSHRERVRVG